jgi:outer membrane protein assembly factor BamB
MPRANQLLSAALITLATAPTALAHDWPHWRGPDRNGTSTESNWLHEWPADGPKVVWKAEVGLGFSSMVIASNRMFTLGHADEQDTVHAFDASTGTTLWKHSYPAELGDKYFEGGTTGTPTVDGDRVYVLSRWGDMLCLGAADGKVHWSKNVQQETASRPPDWGFTGAPLVQGDRVFLNVGEAGLALNKKDGSIAWASGKKEAGYSTPLPFREGNEEVAVFSSGEGYAAVRLRDGKSIWSVRWLTQYGVNAADPILHDGHVFLSSGYGKGSGLFKIGTAQPEATWKSKVLATQMNPAVLHQGHLYGTAGDTTTKAALKCVEFATGTEKWSRPNFGSGGVLIAAGRLIALNGTGELMTAPATPEGFQPTASAQVIGGKTWTAPVLANGIVYCRNARGEVVALNVRRP